MAKLGDKKEEESKGGFFSGLKNWLSDGTSEEKKSGWRWPAIVGGITAVAVSGPIGLGVAAGLWSASKNTDPELSKGQNVGLQAVGATTGAVCSAVGAGIGTAVLPIIGTLIGAIIGAAIGVVAAKIAVSRAKKHKFFSPKSPSPYYAASPEHGRGRGRSAHHQEREMDDLRNSSIKRSHVPNLRSGSKSSRNI